MSVDIKVNQEQNQTLKADVSSKPDVIAEYVDSQWVISGLESAIVKQDIGSILGVNDDIIANTIQNNAREIQT